MKKVDLEKVSSPCVMCYIRGCPYSEESCKSCEYHISFQLLKAILKSYGETCKVCKNRERLGGGYWDCKIIDDIGSCDIDKDFMIDWKAAFEEYE